MLDIEKTVLRRNPEYKDLHKYLVAETEAVNHYMIANQLGKYI
jgi:hypothetical protein